ncbi:hypothetical protein, partial [Tepidimonas fonticaldi]|uniref:hypothetical protein n=1 Tax=Tepidimonas fonticaldi TaxID=1101373 RepID=UPI001C8F2067
MVGRAPWHLAGLKIRGRQRSGRGKSWGRVSASREGLQNLPARLPGWDNSDMKQMSLEAPMYTGFELRAKRTRKR